MQMLNGNGGQITEFVPPSRIFEQRVATDTPPLFPPSYLSLRACNDGVLLVLSLRLAVRWETKQHLIKPCFSGTRSCEVLRGSSLLSVARFALHCSTLTARDACSTRRRTGVRAQQCDGPVGTLNADQAVVVCAASAVNVDICAQPL